MLLSDTRVVNRVTMHTENAVWHLLVIRVKAQDKPNPYLRGLRKNQNKKNQENQYNYPNHCYIY